MSPELSYKNYKELFGVASDHVGKNVIYLDEQSEKDVGSIKDMWQNMLGDSNKPEFREPSKSIAEFLKKEYYKQLKAASLPKIVGRLTKLNYTKLRLFNFPFFLSVYKLSSHWKLFPA